MLWSLSSGKKSDFSSNPNPDEGDHSIIKTLQYKVCEQFEKCMSEYQAGYKTTATTTLKSYNMLAVLCTLAAI